MKNGKILFALVATASIALVVIVCIQKLALHNAQKNVDEIALVNGWLKDSVNKDGLEYRIPPQAIYDFGTEVDEITNPVFTTPAIADTYISDALPGISVELEGEMYFFPYQIMNWHQVVQLEINGNKYSVTFDPLCYAQTVFAGEHLSHTNTVFNNGALLVDEQGSIWSQLKGERAAASNLNAETVITTIPTESILWSEWKTLYPEGKVLSNETGFDFDYTRHPYGAYDDNEIIYFPSTSFDDQLSEKWAVDVLVSNETNQAFARDIEKGFGVENVASANENVAVFFDVESELNRAFNATANDQVLTFTYDFNTQTWTDNETESTWNKTGQATAGELEGTQLEAINLVQSYWFCAAPSYSNVRISQVDSSANEAEETDIVIE